MTTFYVLIKTRFLSQHQFLPFVWSGRCKTESKQCFETYSFTYPNVCSHCFILDVDKIIGASLSEPHITSQLCANCIFSMLFGTSVTRCAAPYSMYSGCMYRYRVDSFQSRVFASTTFCAVRFAAPLHNCASAHDMSPQLQVREKHRVTSSTGGPTKWRCMRLYYSLVYLPQL